MAWMIQSNAEGPVHVADIGLMFTARQIKNVDLIGRQNAERSNDLKWLLDKKFLVELKKDASEDSLDPKLIQQFQETIHQAQAATQAAQAVAENQNNKINQLETQNAELKKQNEELHTKVDSVLEEVKAFAAKFPIEVRTIAEAMRNIKVEQVQVAHERAEIAATGSSEAEIKTHDRILALKEKKLEKNIKDLGSSVSKSAEDIQATIDALDDLNL